jgi:hypothetical protein
MLSPVFVFVSSLLVSLASLTLVRSFGINWDYHIDAVTYVETSSIVANEIFKGSSPVNLGYFLICDLLDSSPSLIVLFNIIIYSLGNMIVAPFFRGLPFSRRLSTILFIVFAISPYRVYLSTTLLKDTLVITLSLLLFLPFLSAVVNSVMPRPLAFIPLTVLLLVRLQAISYLVIPMRLGRRLSRNLLIFFALFILLQSLQAYLGTSVVSVIESASSTDMSFREYDTVPSFSSMGIAGSFLRMLIWPMFVATGSFFLFSPSLQFFFVASGSFAFFIVFLVFFRKSYIGLSSFMLLALTASVTTGFTSFVRYALPVQCISFLFALMAIASVRSRPSYSAAGAAE